MPVILHPYYVGTRPNLVDFYMTNLTGNPLETCIAASRMILSGCLDRHPRSRSCSFIPADSCPFRSAAWIMVSACGRKAAWRSASPPSTYLRRFWYDTITHASTPLSFLVDLVGADRVMFGSDLPFDMADIHFQKYFADAAFDRAALDAITCGNATALFGLERAAAVRRA